VWDRWWWWGDKQSLEVGAEAEGSNLDGSQRVAISRKLHPWKAPSPMAANVASNAISHKLLHPKKAHSPMAVTVSGNTTSSKLVQ
jgi:hypothetical protein